MGRSCPALLLALVLGIPATAAARRGDPALHRCAVELTDDDGTVTTLRAWGPDEASARGQAHRWARILAGERFARRMWAWVLWSDPQDAAPARAQMMRGVGGDPLRTPGARVVDGVCERLPAPGKHAASWSARWPAGDDASVVRAEPTAAIEAARRRSCVGAYDEERRTTFRAIAVASPDIKTPLWRAGQDQALEVLTGCLTGAEPVVAVAEEGKPAAPAHPAYQCQATARTELGAMTGVGWASGQEHAAEGALTELLYTRQRASLSRGLNAAALADAENRQSLIAVAYAASLEGLDGGDLKERGQLSCAGFEPEPLPPLGWHPQDPDVLADCGDRALRPPVTGIESLAGVAEARDELCRDRAYYGIDLVHEAIIHAAPEHRDTLAWRGWGIALGCEADCAARTTLAVSGTPVLFEGLPDRSTRDAAEQALADAIALHDADLLMLLVPRLDSERMRQETERHPIVFWLRLPYLIQLGLESGEIAWRQTGSQWAIGEGGT